MGDADYWRPDAHQPGSPMAAIAARFDQLERTLVERQVEVDALRLRVAVLENWRTSWSPTQVPCTDGFVSIDGVVYTPGLNPTRL